MEISNICPVRITFFGPDQTWSLRHAWKYIIHICWAIFKMTSAEMETPNCYPECLAVCLDSWLPDLQIYAVTPIPESQEVLQREGVPDNIKSFYKVNHIWKFRYDRPFHKGTKDKENEFKVNLRSP